MYIVNLEVRQRKPVFLLFWSFNDECGFTEFQIEYKPYKKEYENGAKHPS